MQTVLLAGNGAPWDELAERFGLTGRRILRAGDMATARRMLQSAPELLLTDFVLAGGDGAALIAERPKKTCAVALSYIRSEAIYAAAVRCGAGECIALPAPASEIVRRAAACEKRAAETIVKNRVYEPVFYRSQDRAARRCEKILLELGLPMTMAGFSLLCGGVRLCVQTPVLLSSLTTALYPKLAGEFGAAPSCVERNMRYAVERIFETAPIEKLYACFGFCADPAKGKLSVGAFLAQMTRLCA